MIRLGIDLGGTKTEIIALDSNGAVLLRERRPTPREADLERDYAAKLQLLADMVVEAERALGLAPGEARVGVGTPGAISGGMSGTAQGAVGLIKNSNSTSLNGRPLLADLQARLARPVRMANDANCFALSEAVDGAAAGAAVVFGVILGTGVGGGVVVDGKVLSGVNGIAGEWGHNPLPLPDAQDLPLPRCYCGRTGCIETYLSGQGLTADHVRAGGENIAAEVIAARATGGDAACEAMLTRYERRLARSLAAVINILDPDVIVLGGGLSNLDRLYRTVPTLWAEHVFSDSVHTRLAKNRHGDSSGVRGAAWLWPLESDPLFR